MKRNVLVVSPMADVRDQIGRWLEDDGYEVMLCPGPSAPGFVCLGGRGEPCPLAGAADVVVLDLHLRSDEAMAGTPSWQLADYYRGSGHGLVTLAAPGDDVRPVSGRRHRAVRRPLSQEEVLTAVRIVEPYVHS